VNILPLILVLGMQNPSPAFVQHEQAGIAAQKQGQLDVAMTEFQKATELNPESAAAFFNLGEVYMQSHRYGDAIKPLKQALTLHGEFPGIHESLGFALLSQGFAAEAVPQFQAANSREGLGIAQLETGDLADAVSNLEAALAAHPDNPDLLYYFGRATGLLSRQINDKLLSSYPATPRAYQSLAESYAALHQAKQAEEAYQKAIKLRPDLPGLHLALGEVYAQAAEWDKAEEEFRAEAKLRPGSAETAFQLGSALLQNGHLDQAEEQLAHANQLQPDMPQTLYALGKASSMRGNNKAAVDSFTRAVTLEPTGPLAAQAHFALAAIYRKQGKTAEAQEEIQLYQKLKPANSGPSEAPAR
jgi:tetratricopeptide (TPR) repeat protein